MTTLHKGGHFTDQENYWPINLISLICKAMESNKELIYADKGNLSDLDPNQVGFVKGKSCLLKLVSFSEKVTQAVDSGHSPHTLF